MTEQIAPNLYRLEIPLPDSPLKSLNSYVVKAADHCLIIDTGMNRIECEQSMRSQLSGLGIDPERADYFITHMHMDHFGLVGKLAGQSSRIYFHRIDEAIFRGGFTNSYWERSIDNYVNNGMARELLQKAIPAHPNRLFRNNVDREYIHMGDGDSIQAGDYTFRCIETPGHSPGHTCLYEADKRILVSGDHILFDISPNITFWQDFNALESYLQSLDKVYDLDVDIVLPGHRSLQRSHRERIDELKVHHQQRLAEICTVLEGGPRCAYEIAPFISWDSHGGDWEQFPPQQQFFAMGETIAHIDYLLTKGKIKKQASGATVTYCLT